MYRKVNNSHGKMIEANYLLAVVHKSVNPEAPPSRRCRFDLFVRVAPGQASIPSRNGPQRTWCYRGDKYTDQEFKMLRNLLSLVTKNITRFDRVELYDNDKKIEERTILKITDGVIDTNQLKQYTLMLTNYPLADFLK